MRLGIYLLRPPQHRQNLLANAQMGWLRGPEAAADGWHTLPDAFTAQTEANRGRLVTAVFENPNPNKPGHIAIIRPGRITASALAADGPIVTQAGSHNALAVPLPRASVGTPVRGYRVAPALSASSRMMWLGYKSERPNNAISVRQDIITDINGRYGAQPEHAGSKIVVGEGIWACASDRFTIQPLGVSKLAIAPSRVTGLPM
jgi:hypothetical protein